MKITLKQPFVGILSFLSFTIIAILLYVYNPGGSSDAATATLSGLIFLVAVFQLVMAFLGPKLDNR
jgi:hypothetical protein